MSKFECEYCERRFENIGGGKVHQRNCNLKPENQTFCLECNKVLTKKTQKKFCSRSCSVKHNNIGSKQSKETKNKIRNTLLNKKSTKKKCIVKVKKCRWCKKLFITSLDKKSIGYTRTTCSEFCLHKLRSKKSRETVSNKKRSKNEKEFANLCKKTFKNVITNKPMFNGWDADVILPKYKVAVLWNGKWHYEKITQKHSLKQVKNRDKIKISEIKGCGYDPYIIKDMGGYDVKFVKSKFSEFKQYIAG